MVTSVLWFRRDLRLGDHPALLAAADAGPDGVLPLFVLDPILLATAGSHRRDFLYDSLRALHRSLDGRLVVRSGIPTEVVASVAREIDAPTVHISADFAPYGCRRDAAVEKALGEDNRTLVRTGSSYAVAPGRVVNGSGVGYQVFTPFYKAWVTSGWRSPAESGYESARWLDGISSETIPAGDGFTSTLLPAAGETAALARLELVVQRGGYAEARNTPGIEGTTLLSAALRWGCLHPRTVLAKLGPSDGILQKELAWREFYADVLHRVPSSATQSMALSDLPVDTDSLAQRRFAIWQRGQTGYPLVDAGMRQLSAEGWMHNRVRMVVASFLVKDLHLPWQWGARHFMDQLVDGDLASNSHGWQWSAGTGTDAAPFFRIFNPVTQAKTFDADGSYVRRYVPELRGVSDKWVHEPWLDPAGPPTGYPARMLDHGVERAEALARLKGRS